MANCKYIKLKLNHKLECKLTKKIITWEQCKNCKLREYNLTNIKLQNKQNNCSFYKKTAKSGNKSSKSGKNKNISKRVRELIHERDKHICQLHGGYGNHLHHIVYRSEDSSLIDEPTNIITLCYDCHKLVHSNKKKYKPILLKKMDKIVNNFYVDR